MVARQPAALAVKMESYHRENKGGCSRAGHPNHRITPVCGNCLVFLTQHALFEFGHINSDFDSRYRGFRMDMHQALGILIHKAKRLMGFVDASLFGSLKK